MPGARWTCAAICSIEMPVLGAAAWLSDAAPSLGATALIGLGATAVAVRVFRWEPRA